MKFWLYLFLSLSLTTPLKSQDSKLKLVPKIWNGEALQGDEGLFYLQGAILDQSAQSLGGQFSFELHGTQQRSVYSLSFSCGTMGQHPDKVWKVKVDNYEVRNVQHIDGKGQKWFWSGPYKHPLLIRKQSLSNFGSFYLVLLKQKGQLSFLIKIGQNVFQPQKSQGSFESIINGVSGMEMLALERKAPQKAGEIRAVIRTTRTIGMFYKLNLFRQNQHAKTVMDVIQANDPDIRSCYTDAIERGLEQQGQMNFTILLSHQTHSIRSMKLKLAEIKDEKFLECLYYKLMALSFPVPESMIGELGFQFQLTGG